MSREYKELTSHFASVFGRLEHHVVDEYCASDHQHLKIVRMLKMAYLDFPSCFFRELNNEVVVEWVDWTFAVAFTGFDH